MQFPALHLGLPKTKGQSRRELPILIMLMVNFLVDLIKALMDLLTGLLNSL